MEEGGEGGGVKGGERGRCGRSRDYWTRADPLDDTAQLHDSYPPIDLPSDLLRSPSVSSRLLGSLPRLSSALLPSRPRLSPC